MIEEGIFALLSEDPGVTASLKGRVWSVLLPEGELLPALTYQIVGGQSFPTLNSSGMQKVRMQFDAFADQECGGYLAVGKVRDALIELLNGFQGLLADGTYLQNAELLWGASPFQEYPRQFRCTVEFYLYFNFPS